MTDGLLNEEKSRFSILVIGSDAEFIRNAEVRLKGHRVKLATTLHEASEMMLGGGCFDFIISDAYMPVDKGREQVAVVSEVLAMCEGSGTPVCFFAKTDKDGRLGGKGYVTLKVVRRGDAIRTALKSAFSTARPSEERLFEGMTVTGTRTWEMALNLLGNETVGKQDPLDVSGKFARPRGPGVVLDRGTRKPAMPNGYR